MQVKIKKIRRNAKDLFRATDGSAGYDIYACFSNINETITLNPLDRTMIPTGLSTELPKGIEMQIRPRSGNAIKRGLTLINCIGTVDADYRGEICVLVVNLSNEIIEIKNGERIAQVVFNKYISPEFIEVEELSETSRGDSGFGSSGDK